MDLEKISAPSAPDSYVSLHIQAFQHFLNFQVGNFCTYKRMYMGGRQDLVNFGAILKESRKKILPFHCLALPTVRMHF